MRLLLNDILFRITRGQHRFETDSAQGAWREWRDERFQVYKVFTQGCWLIGRDVMGAHFPHFFGEETRPLLIKSAFIKIRLTPFFHRTEICFLSVSQWLHKENYFVKRRTNSDRLTFNERGSCHSCPSVFEKWNICFMWIEESDNLGND